MLSCARAAIEHGRMLNIKKGQFLAPWDVKNIQAKVESCLDQASPGKKEDFQFFLTERGTSFGYQRLVVDMSAIQIVQSYGLPVIYDATHSVQNPGAGIDGKTTGGNRENIEVLARSAMAAGASGVFLEVHPDPKKALSDGPQCDAIGSDRRFC